MTPRRAALAAALSTLCLQTATAGPADYVYTPTVEYGEREIDFKAGTASKKGEADASAASVGFGYGATEWWFTEIYGKWNRGGTGGTRFDAFEWENKFQLTETGKYPVDLGFLLEIERPQDRSEGYEVKYGPLLQTDLGKFTVNANLLFERHYRATEPSNLEAGYQLQVKYRYRPEFEFGLQAFGDLGKWNRWERAGEQSQRVGPAIFGKFKLEGRQAIKYNAAFLVGTTGHSPDRNFRMQVEYEF
ncbi:MAG: hypothetical protein ACM3SV_06050 [Betaproteobacteria bacterium]